MSIKRFLCAFLTILLVLAAVPTVALAQGAAAELEEARKLGLLDEVWDELNEAERIALESGADMSAVTMAVYKAALQNEYVDEKSFNSLTEKSFFFTVEGMACGYDYTASNYDPAEPLTEPTVIKIPATKNGPTNMNVLLVGPYYGHDSSFTNQYRNEAQSIATTTGGEYVLLQSTGATGPAIANACPDAGVVIFDSHGSQSGTSSYLCLTTNNGITSDDYSNGWAVRDGSAAWIDGRYIQHHAPSTLPNNIFWMAICEGMKRAGQGTTGNALLDAGAGCVYGYSQSVTFAGDYAIESLFWNKMKNENATVAEAFAYMVANGCSSNGSEPHGNAFPIVMSPVDPFPSNPDSAQTVYCDWQLFGGSMDPVALESWSLSNESVEVLIGSTADVTFNRIPDNANQYELVWHSEDETVATVNGNNRRVSITAVGLGQTRIYCEVFDMNNTQLGTAYCSVSVTYDVALSEAACVEGGHLVFSSVTSQYPWAPVSIDGRNAAKSGNAGVDSSSSTMALALTMQAGETLSFDWKVSSESGYDKLGFYVNGAQNGSLISGTTSWATITFTAPSTGVYTFQWTYTKDYSVGSGNDCGYVDNVTYSGDHTYDPGDLDGNGEIEIDDALQVLRIALGLINSTGDQQAIADVNGDGIVNIEDALYVLRVALGLIN